MPQRRAISLTIHQSGRAPTEASYAVQKFIRAGYGTNRIDNCSRH